MKGPLAIAAALCAAIALSQPASAGVEPQVATFTSGDFSELVKTIPISSKRGAKPKVVMRIDGGRLGPVQAGDRFLSAAEVEVTTCLDGPGGDDICVGKSYPYDPHVAAKLVLADQAGGTSGQVLAPARELECRQRHPNRNHHCVLVLPWRQWVAERDCNGCHVNLVMTAWRSDARRGHELVIGAHSSSGPIDPDKGRVSLVRFRNGALPGDTQPELGNARASRVPIVGESQTPRPVFVRSVKLSDLDEGDEIHVQATAKASISRYRYNALLQSNLYLATNRSAPNHVGTGRYIAPDGQLSELNGFNCTQGPSAHSTPCRITKVGVGHVREHVGELYAILVVSARAMLNESNPHAWDSGDAAKIVDSSLRAYVHRR